MSDSPVHLGDQIGDHIVAVVSAGTVIGSFASILSTALSIILTSVLIFWYVTRLWKDRKDVREFLGSWRRPKDPKI